MLFIFSILNPYKQFISQIYLHFTLAVVDILNKIEELNSELHGRVYFCLFKNK